MFNQLREYILQKYPNVEVTGAEYPPHPNKVFASKIISYIQYAIYGITLAGDFIFSSIGIPYPAICLKLKENKMTALFGTFFVGNLITNQLLSTGAFEVMINEDVLYSKLSTGRMPSPEELAGKLASKLD